MSKQPDNNILDSLYREHVHDLFSYALHLGFDKETCQDAIQDVFCKLCTDRIALDAIQHVRFYLLRALKNRLLDLHKQKRNVSELPLDTLPEDLPFTVRVTAEDEWIASEENEKTRQIVESMLQALSDRQREIIYLRYTHECSYEEIAQLMHISVNSCRKLLSKTLLKLKSLSLPLSCFLLCMG